MADKFDKAIMQIDSSNLAGELEGLINTAKGKTIFYYIALSYRLRNKRQNGVGISENFSNGFRYDSWIF